MAVHARHTLVYWNAKSQEEIIKHIACEIDHITAYLDEIVTDINKTLNDYDTRIKTLKHT